MKLLKTMLLLGAVMAIQPLMTSCNDDDDNGVKVLPKAFEIGNKVTFNKDNYWIGCYDSKYNSGLTVTPFKFSHSSTITEWDGVEYKSWKGFCPSKVADRTDYTGKADWIDHQWASYDSGETNPFMLACWDVQENYADPTTATSCTMAKDDGSTFVPLSMHIANSAWGYYSMKNGSDFNKPFGDKDYCFVRIYGLQGLVVKGQIDVYLAKDGKILSQWEKADLSTLGEVDKLVFTMSSSDSGAYGMNNAAYFCMSGFIYLDAPAAGSL